jgi:predicted O-methyltransferase YrrM
MKDAEQHPAQGRIARAIERRIGSRYQRFQFWRAMRRYLRAVEQGREAQDPQLLGELVRGWGNSWSAQTEFLEASLRETRETAGPILECGSGLSTLLIGAVAQARGIRVWALEHDPRWADRVRKYLRKYRIDAVTLCMAPIRSFGDFDWYSLTSLQTLPGKISLVICDGPPGGTRGGRYGLVPVMLDKLRPDCTILLDDGARDEERAIAERWAQTILGKPELIGSEKPFIRLRAGRSTSNTLSS